MLCLQPKFLKSFKVNIYYLFESRNNLKKPIAINNLAFLRMTLHVQAGFHEAPDKKKFLVDQSLSMILAYFSVSKIFRKELDKLAQVSKNNFSLRNTAEQTFVSYLSSRKSLEDEIILSKFSESQKYQLILLSRQLFLELSQKILDIFNAEEELSALLNKLFMLESQISEAADLNDIFRDIPRYFNDIDVMLIEDLGFHSKKVYQILPLFQTEEELLKIKFLNCKILLANVEFNKNLAIEGAKRKILEIDTNRLLRLLSDFAKIKNENLDVIFPESVPRCAHKILTISEYITAAKTTFEVCNQHILEVKNQIKNAEMILQELNNEQETIINSSQLIKTVSFEILVLLRGKISNLSESEF